MRRDRSSKTKATRKAQKRSTGNQRQQGGSSSKRQQHGRDNKEATGLGRQCSQGEDMKEKMENYLRIASERKSEWQDKVRDNEHEEKRIKKRKGRARRKWEKSSKSKQEKK